MKLFPNEIGNVNYHAYNKRIEALNSQHQNFNVENIKKYLPGYLIPNENIIKQDFNNKLSPEDESEKERVNVLLNKYKDFLTLLKDDLKKNIENNLILSADILEIEEERNYYLEKLITISDYCKDKSTKLTNESDIKNLNEVLKILNHVPEDFK